MEKDEADVASVVGLRQQIEEGWPDGERKDTVLKAIDSLLRGKRGDSPERREQPTRGPRRP